MRYEKYEYAILMTKMKLSFSYTYVLYALAFLISGLMRNSKKNERSAHVQHAALLKKYFFKLSENFPHYFPINIDIDFLPDDTC